MRIDHILAALRGQPQPPAEQASQEPIRPRGQPCTLEQMDARLAELSKFINARPKMPPTPGRSPAIDSAKAKDDPNALRTWFVLKSLDEASSNDARDQQPPQPPARPKPEP